MTVELAPSAVASKHTLLTLVNHVVGYTELLIEVRTASLTEALLAQLKTIHADGKALIGLITTIYTADPPQAAAARTAIDAPLTRIAAQCQAILDAEGPHWPHAEDLGNVATASRKLRAAVSATPAPPAAPPPALPQATSTRPAAAPGPSQGVVLVVDDADFNRDILSRHLLRMGYTVETAADGRAAMDIVQSRPIDLVLLDMVMPELDGFEVLTRIKATEHLRHLPVIMISAIDQLESVARCIEAGAVDYLPKPFNPTLLRARVGACIQTKRLMDRDRDYRRQIEQHNTALEHRVSEQVREITMGQMATIFALSKLAESRDPETGAHLERMREYSKALANTMLSQRLHPEVDAAFVASIYAASPLHDIGKVGVPDHILQKPGKLTVDEFEIMKTHSAIGGQTLREVHANHDSNTFVGMGIEIAEGHHEKWNGKGYPKGLAGDAIPLAARIVALADVYDALTSRRCYKEPMSHAQARDIILRDSGGHFDPGVVACFVAAESVFVEIAACFE